MVLERLEKAGLHVCVSKCEFMVSSVSYLGQQIDKDGLHPLPAKMQAVVEATSPRSAQELKAHLGLLTYYWKSLPDVFAVSYCLLRKESWWQWIAEEEKAFCKSKELDDIHEPCVSMHPQTSSKLLVHFDASLPLTLACDASAYRVGAVLAHRMSDGIERPTGCASRTLSPAELLLGRRPRSKPDLLRPNTAECVEGRQLQQKLNHDVLTRAHTFQEGEEAYLRNFSRGEMWLPS